MSWDSCSKSEFPVDAIFTSPSNPSPSHHLTTISAAPNSFPLSQPLQLSRIISFLRHSLTPLQAAPAPRIHCGISDTALLRKGAATGSPGALLKPGWPSSDANLLLDTPSRCLDYNHLGFVIGTSRKAVPKGRVPKQDQSSPNHSKKVELLSYKAPAVQTLLPPAPPIYPPARKPEYNIIFHCGHSLGHLCHITSFTGVYCSSAQMLQGAAGPAGERGELPSIPAPHCTTSPSISNISKSRAVFAPGFCTPACLWCGAQSRTQTHGMGAEAGPGVC